ncbi:aminotransferase class III-fold pyridoxal phosphate-dependent enzyme, partial [Amycolatopsis sp. NPDC000673]
IAAGVEALGHPLVSGVRGAGLLLGIGLREPVSAAVAKAAQDAGYLVNPVAPDTVRLAPPLVLDEQQAHGFLSALPGALDSTTTKESD